MDNDTVIKVEHLSKKYCKFLKKSMYYGMMDIGRNMFGLASHSERLKNGEFWALDDLSFDVKKGETLGVIGANGSGKTTLLKLLNGIFWPDRGRIAIKGRVGVLIEVGAGFHPLLTGRENIYINSAILGMAKKEVDKKFDAIVEFSDIGDFLDTPVKYYSSGMFVRLGFAIAVHCDPDILLIDEVLAVGDLGFRMKCTEKIKEMQRNQKTIIYVSHELETVKRICRRCLWLNDGRLEMVGNPNQVVDLCADYMKNNRLREVSGIGVGVEHVNIIKAWTEDENGKERNEFNFGENITVRVKYSLLKPVEDLIFGIAIFTGDNICISALHTGLDRVKIGQKLGMNEVALVYPNIHLLSGTFYLDIGFFENMAVTPFVYASRVCKIGVKSPFLADGLLVIDHRWEVK